MTCADLEILLCDYVDGTLDRERKAVVSDHLAGCVHCAELVRDAAAAVAFIDRVAEVEVPQELVTRVLFEAPRRKGRSADRRGVFRRFFARFLQPVLQPRFAMGMAMTILSFSMLGQFLGIRPRQLRVEDLKPARVWAAIEDRAHQAWDKAVKYYESLRLVYEIRSRLKEWTAPEEAETKPAPQQPAPESDQAAPQ